MESFASILLILLHKSRRHLSVFVAGDYTKVKRSITLRDSCCDSIVWETEKWYIYYITVLQLKQKIRLTDFSVFFFVCFIYLIFFVGSWSGVNYLNYYFFFQIIISPVGWGSRMHRLHLCKAIRKTPPQRVSWYDTKQSDGETPVLELWENAEYPLVAIAPRFTEPEWEHLIGSFP